MRILSVLFVLGFLSAIFAAPPHHNPQVLPPHATMPHSYPHIKGVVGFERASFEKQKEALKLEFKEKQAIENKKQELKQKIKALELEKKLLEIDLQKARIANNNAELDTILKQISQKEYQILTHKNEEKSTIEQMKIDLIQKLNTLLGY